MKTPVSLVLSSGGARGIAHIGVIEELERQGFEIRSIAGSSMGALVGGMYASGNLKIFKDWMCKLDKKAVYNLVDFTFSTSGLVKGNKIINELQKIVPDINIEDLPMPYTAVSTDIINKEEVVFEKGSLYKAIRASISIPGVFTPHTSGDKVMIDGGVINPLPINRIKRTKNDLLVAVDVNSKIPPHIQSVETNTAKQGKKQSGLFSFSKGKGNSSLPKTKAVPFNYYSLLTHSSSLMLQQITALTVQMYQPDILISISHDSYSIFHFYKAAEIIQSGVLATQKELLKFRNKK